LGYGRGVAGRVEGLTRNFAASTTTRLPIA
jgi:hypothetical protein